MYFCKSLWHQSVHIFANDDLFWVSEDILDHEVAVEDSSEVASNGVDNYHADIISWQSWDQLCLFFCVF